MLLAGEDSIREIIPFPMNKNAQDAPFATHYPVRFRFYPRLSPFVPLGVGFFLPRPSSPGGGSKGESTKAPPGADKKRPASEEMARLAAHQGWESCCRNGAFGLLPRPWGLVSKGVAEAPRPLCRWGSRAKSKRPGAFLPGVWGGFFPEKNAPHVPAVGTVPCGSRKLCESARHRRRFLYPKS